MFLRSAHLSVALADYRQGKFQSAVDRLQGANASVLVPMPQLILAMAQYRLGNTSEVAKLLNQAIRSFDWSDAQATDDGAWMYHVLRHDAEGLHPGS